MKFCVILRLTMLSSVFFMSAVGAAVPLSDESAFEVIEGDILVTPDELAAIDKEENEESRNGLINVLRRWPNKTVVFHIKENVFDEEQIRKLHTAMRDIENQTCIKFRERQDKNEHAAIIQDKGLDCASRVGFRYNLPNQMITLGKNCFVHRILVHELLHTVGFEHMHNTYNRDDFVTINWDNVIDDEKRNFKKKSPNVVTDFGVPYDYDSVMHYHRTAFSKNGLDTIVPKQNVVIGQGTGLSPGDLLKVNKMYCTPENTQRVGTIIPPINSLNYHTV